MPILNWEFIYSNYKILTLIEGWVGMSSGIYWVLPLAVSQLAFYSLYYSGSKRGNALFYKYTCIEVYYLVQL